MSDVVLLVAGLALYIYTFIDLASARSDDVRLLPRLVWLLVVLVVPVVGCVAWLVLGRPVASHDDRGGDGGLRLRLPPSLAARPEGVLRRARRAGRRPRLPRPAR